MIRLFSWLKPEPQPAPPSIDDQLAKLEADIEANLARAKALRLDGRTRPYSRRRV